MRWLLEGEQREREREEREREGGERGLILLFLRAGGFYVFAFVLASPHATAHLDLNPDLFSVRSVGWWHNANALCGPVCSVETYGVLGIQGGFFFFWAQGQYAADRKQHRIN